MVVKLRDPLVTEKLKFKKELSAKRCSKPNKVFLVLYGLLASLEEVRGKSNEVICISVSLRYLRKRI